MVARALLLKTPHTVVTGPGRVAQQPLPDGQLQNATGGRQAAGREGDQSHTSLSLESPVPASATVAQLCGVTTSSLSRREACSAPGSSCLALLDQEALAREATEEEKVLTL